MIKLSAKERMLNALNQKQGRNTFTVKQAQQRFGISNVAARILELREEGHPILTTVKTGSKGTRLHVYSMSKPSNKSVGKRI